MSTGEIQALIETNPHCHVHVVGTRWTLLRFFPFTGLLFDPEGRPGITEDERRFMVLAEGTDAVPDILRGTVTGIWLIADGSELMAWDRGELLTAAELTDRFQVSADEMYWATIGEQLLESQGFSCPKWYEGR